MFTRLLLSHAARTNRIGEYTENATVTTAVRFEHRGEVLDLVFFNADHAGGARVCGSWYGPTGHPNGRDMALLSNRTEHGQGPIQRVTWAQCDSGILLAAQWFLDQKNEWERLHIKQAQQEAHRRRVAREERTRLAHPNGLKGGTGNEDGPLFKLPAA